MMSENACPLHYSTSINSIPSSSVEKAVVPTMEKLEQKSLNLNALNKYATDLTKLAFEGKLDAVIGRKEETDRCIQILCKRSGNNVCLTGHPGVGKSVIVEGLAQCIVNSNIPSKLNDTKRWAGLLLEQVCERVKKVKNIEVKVTDKFEEKLMEEGCSSSYGARPLKRAITRLFEDYLCEEILKGELEEGDVITIDVDPNGNVVHSSS